MAYSGKESEKSVRLCTSDNDTVSFRHEPDDMDTMKKKVKYLLKHIKCQTEEGKVKELPRTYGYLSVGYLKMNLSKEAEWAATTQAEMAVECKDDSCLLQAYSNLGIIKKRELKMGEAMEYYDLALELATKQNNKNAMLHLYCNIGNAREMQMQFELAVENQEKMLEIAKEKKNRDAVVKACGSLTSLHHNLGNELTTMEYLEQLMEQLRSNVKVLDTLADDVAGSDDGGYINIEENDEEGEEGMMGEMGERGGGGGAEVKLGVFGKLKKKITDDIPPSLFSIPI